MTVNYGEILLYFMWIWFNYVDSGIIQAVVLTVLIHFEKKKCFSGNQSRHAYSHRMLPLTDAIFA